MDVEKHMDDNTKRGSSTDAEAEHYELEQDSFSFLFVADIFSVSFFTALFIFLLQIISIFLFIVTELKEENTTAVNPVGVPVMVDGAVRAGQLIATIITVITSSDLLTSLDIFYIPYDKTVEKTFEHASAKRWYFSNICRLVCDLLVVAISFIIIVQSSNNLSLFSNFAAVSFVSGLDEAAFALFFAGFGTRGTARLSKNIVDNLKFKVTQSRDKERRVKNWCLSFLCVILLSGYISIFVLQHKNYYFKDHCQLFDVKFQDLEYNFFQQSFNEVCEGATDEEDSKKTCPQEWMVRSEETTQNAKTLKYISFNGVYEMQKKLNRTRVEGFYEMMNGRPIYVQRGRTGFNAFGKNSPPGRIMYCDGSWVFNIPGVHKGSVDHENFAAADVVDSCHWLLKSPKTTEYDLAKVPMANWVVWTGNRVQIAKDLSIHCTECEGSGTPTTPVVGCTYKGVCSKEKTCVCDAGWLGVQCETSVCDTLTTFWGNSTWSYARVDDEESNGMTVYGRPVYLLKEVDSKPYIENEYWAANYGSQVSQVLMFTGFDYVFINLSFDSNDEMLHYLRLFHTGWNYDYTKQISYKSMRTTAPMPTGLTWYSQETGEEIKFEMDC